MLLAEGADNVKIATEINKDTQLNLQVEEGLFAKEDKDILAQVAWKAGISENINYNNQVVIVLVKNVVASTPKKLNESKGNGVKFDACLPTSPGNCSTIIAADKLWTQAVVLYEKR
jgi:hypothetical protein